MNTALTLQATEYGTLESLAVEINDDLEIVALAKEAHAKAEKEEAGASPSRWVEADCYAELAKRGWTVRKIAEECETNKTTVSVFINVVSRYRDKTKRPSFWGAYQEVQPGKTTAELIVSSNENDWYTPEKYIEAARAVLGAIDLDPASCKLANKTVKAKKFYTIQDDGLHLPWKGRLWMNPPYGRLAGEFVGRLLLEYEAGEVDAAILLVNSNCTDTDWFQPLWDHRLCFTNHRIEFVHPTRERKSGSTHGSVFVYLGKNRKKFLAEFAQFGRTVRADC